MRTDLKKWYSFCENGSYVSSDSPFFEITDKPWKKLLESKYEQIASEFKNARTNSDKNIIPYYNKNLASDSLNWKILPLYIWGNKKADNCEKCPVTSAIAESIEGMTSCSFSILKPNTYIKPHIGDSNVMYRCHLTIKSEGHVNDIGIRVLNEIKTWEKGTLFAFCDAYEHEVWNKTNEERWVLIIDILREEFIDQKANICKEVNATLFWQLAFQKYTIISHLPKWSRKLLIKLSKPFF